MFLRGKGAQKSGWGEKGKEWEGWDGDRLYMSMLEVQELMERILDGGGRLDGEDLGWFMRRYGDVSWIYLIFYILVQLMFMIGFIFL